MTVPATGRELHVDQPLSNIVINRRPAGFIADQFIPVMPVAKQSDMYYKFRHGEWKRYDAGLTLRAPRAEARKVHMGVASDTYFCHNYALATDWTVEDQVNADAVLNWAERHSGFLMDRLMMDYEWRLAEFAVNTSNVRTVSIVTSGWQGAGAVPLTDLLTYKEQFRQATGMIPNTLIIPEGIRRHITINAQLRDILYGDRGGMVTLQQLGDLIGIEKVLVPTVQANTAGEYETELGSWSHTDVWGNHSIWMTYTQNLGGEGDSWIQAFRWTNPMFGQPFSVFRYPYNERKRTFDIEVSYYQTEKVVASDLAMRIIVNSA